MRNMQVSKDIVPIGEFKTHASEIIRKVKASRRPLVITQNGRPAAVLVAPEEFDGLVERQRFIGAVKQGLADAEAGRVIPDDRLATDADPSIVRRRS